MSLAVRAVLAVALTIGFYVGAIGLALALLAVPVGALLLRHVLFVPWIVLGPILAATILTSILPVPIRFRPPGPELELAKQPALQEQIRDIARRVRGRLPDEVYLSLECNAMVTQTGGFLGLGVRRVMVLGLPLMQMLTIPEFRAVLAHEYAHYRGSGTGLQIWAYRTRQAIIESLVRVRRVNFAVHALFELYAILFLRITQAMSRQAELVADALGASLAGAGPAISGLRKVAAGGVVFRAYLEHDFAPLVGAGVQPPLAHGFARVIRQTSVQEQIERLVQDELVREPADPYSSHPSLAERLAALERLPTGPEAGNDEPAAGLLRDLPQLERAAVAMRLKAGTPLPEYVSWEEVGSRVMLPIWRRQLLESAAQLSGATLYNLPERAVDSVRLGYALPRRPGTDLTAAQVKETALQYLSLGLCTVLAAQGWEIEVMPGDPIRLQCSGTTIDPLTAVRNLADRRVDAEAWRAWCRDARLVDAPLVPAVRLAATPRPGKVEAVDASTASTGQTV